MPTCIPNKFLFIFFFLPASFTLHAQQQYVHVQMQAVVSGDVTETAKKELSFFTTDNDLIIKSISVSPHCTYYSCTQTFRQIPILHTQIILKVKNEQLISINGTAQDTRTWQPHDFPGQVLLSPPLREKYHLTNDSLTEIFLIKNEDGLQYAYQYAQHFPDHSFISLIVDEKGDVVEEDDHRVYYSTGDSLVSGLVFLPDPLTTAHVSYGGVYVDDNDADDDALTGQVTEMPFRVKFSNDTFFLENDYFTISDFAAPEKEVITSVVPHFDFTRHYDAFEDVNAFYHLNIFSDYISSLGYDVLRNFFTDVDTHGAGGADQSFFIGGTDPSIQYGEGGVDDAEDADVIIHEYGHALSDHAAPGSNSGFERRAIDEGYGDYFAVSYSRQYSDFNWANIFSWDGHNEFWPGRNADTDKHYPEDLSGSDYYANSEIWSGALMDIFDAIGKENCDKIVFEALYGSYIDMTMPQAAQAILAAEEIVFSGTYHDIIFSLLDARGLISGVPVTNISKDQISIRNTIGFCSADEPLCIFIPDNTGARIRIFDMQGKEVCDLFSYEEEIYIRPELSAGVYVISVTTPGAHDAQTIIKMH